VSTSFAATTESESALGDERPVGDPSGGRRRRTVLIASGLLLVIVVPLVVALVSLHSPRWYPSLEYAQYELHVRDVGTSDTPLTGLIGRLGVPEVRGSHPGPLSFYALAPAYRLAGSSPWALQVATVVLHVVGVAAALLIGFRRGGVALMALTAATMTVLVRFYGAMTITEPWNPYLPLVWWVVFVLAVWSVVEDDLPMLPVAIVAGSLCAQTHISYVALVGGLTAWAGAAVVVRAVRRREDGRALARRLGWLALAVVGGAVLWIPPVLDQFREPGHNLAIIVDYLTSGVAGAPIGFARGLQLLVANLDPWRLLTGHATAKMVDESPSWSVPALLFLAGWAGTVVAAWRIRHWPLVRLHATIGIALALGVVQTSRIVGFVWQWLVLWVWGTGALVLLAIGWTVVSVVERRPPVSVPVRRAAVAALAVVMLVGGVALTTDAADVRPDDVASSRALSRLVPPVVDALDELSTSRPGSRYLVAWSDPVGVVGELQGFGLVNELDRRGIPVGLPPDKRLRAAPYLTMERQDATAVVHLATGRAIDYWRAVPGARLLAEFDPRTPQEHARQDRLRQQLSDELAALGRPDLFGQIEGSFIGFIFVLRDDPAIPEHVVDLMHEILEIGTPTSVFLVT
jgi:hypothetical protein